MDTVQLNALQNGSYNGLIEQHKVLFQEKEHYKKLYNAVLKYFKQKTPHFDAHKHFEKLAKDGE